MATKKTASKKAAGKKTAGKKQAGKRSVTAASATTRAKPGSMPKAGKNPEGGLTAKGRALFAEKEGLHLRPGVQGPADTPEKMVRKGSFLRRHFANPQGPMKDGKGAPTRLALSAHAWGEPVPENLGDAKKLAHEGHELLEQYHAAKDGAKQGNAGARKTTQTAYTKKVAAKSPAGKDAAPRAARGSAAPGKKVVGKSAGSKPRP